MHHGWTEEQQEFRATLRRFLESRSPEAEVRRLMDTAEGWDAVVWSAMADQLGVQGLAVPESFGGSGFTFAETVIAAEEIGRVLLSAPFLSTVVLAANALLAVGGAAAEEHLRNIVAGTTIATVALLEEPGRWDEDGVAMRAVRAGDGYELTGSKHFVLDGEIAGVVLVTARTPAGVGLFAVDGSAPRLARTAQGTMDLTRRMAVLNFDQTPARLISREGQGWQVLRPVLDRAAIALAAEQVGGAQGALELSVSYAKSRKQFGRPIGSFQAIRHLCADMFVDVETARSIVHHAAWAAAAGSPDIGAMANLAKAYCSEIYVRVAAATIQIHGAMGFTWEHPAHLYYKRALSDAQWLGDADRHRRAFAERIGL
jgi:alkylation response protein AidB-like acyl-CoA dehydrogenase